MPRVWRWCCRQVLQRLQLVALALPVAAPPMPSVSCSALRPGEQREWRLQDRRARDVHRRVVVRARPGLPRSNDDAPRMSGRELVLPRVVDPNACMRAVTRSAK